jgi:hypothetical protein
MQVPEGSGKDLNRITEKRSDGSGALTRGGQQGCLSRGDRSFQVDSCLNREWVPGSTSCAIEPLSQDPGPLSAS